MHLGPSGADASTIPARKLLPLGHKSQLVVSGKRELQCLGREVRQKDPRVPGRGFLAGLEHLTASISAGPGRPPGATTLRGLQGSLRQLESYTFPLGYLFLFACCEAFRFLYSLPKSNHKILGNFA